MIRSGRASPATMESMSMRRMWLLGFAGSMSTRPRPLNVTVSWPGGVSVIFELDPASFFE